MKGREPPHVHVESAERRAKYWLTLLSLAWNDGFRLGELKGIEKLVAANLDSHLETWHAFLGS